MNPYDSKKITPGRLLFSNHIGFVSGSGPLRTVIETAAFEPKR